jgi:3-methyladenine DNA glycosylase AlkC
MKEKFSLKDQLFNPVKIGLLSASLQNVYPDFERHLFENEIIEQLPQLELKARIKSISKSLQKYLPQDYKTAVHILINALPEALDESKTDNDFGDFIYAPFAEFIATFGCNAEHLFFSLNALKEITKRFSAEFSIRAFINKFLQETLIVIEDCAESHGATVNGKVTGSFGDMACFSFYANKIITTGEGGAVFVRSPLVAKQVESFRDWGRDCYCETGCDNTCKKRFEWQLGDLPLGYDHKYIYSHIGYNLKATDMQAALGLSQLSKLENFIAKRKENFKKNNLDDNKILWGDIQDPITYSPLLREGQFDALLAMGVTPHVRNDDFVIQNMRDMVKPGGRVFIEFRNKLFSFFTFNRYTYEFIMDDLLRGVSPKLKKIIAIIPEIYYTE